MKDPFRFWAGVIILIVGIILTFIGFFTMFITWFYGIPAIIIGILLLLNIGEEENIEKIKKRGK